MREASLIKLFSLQLKSQETKYGICALLSLKCLLFKPVVPGTEFRALHRQSSALPLIYILPPHLQVFSLYLTM